MSGIALIQAGDKAAAEKELKTASDFRDKDVAALAKMALASMYRGTNRAPEAIAIYKDLSEHPTVTVSKSQAQLELAEMYETTDPQQAALIYQQLQKEDPRSPAAQLASQKTGQVQVNFGPSRTGQSTGSIQARDFVSPAATFAVNPHLY